MAGQEENTSIVHRRSGHLGGGFSGFVFENTHIINIFIHRFQSSCMKTGIVIKELLHAESLMFERRSRCARASGGRYTARWSGISGITRNRR